MKTSETTLREIYDISNKEVKEKMELEFPTLFKKSSILNEAILNEAISYLTEEDEEVVKLRKLEKIEGIDNILAEQRLVVIFRAKNEKFIFDWNDDNQPKHYPWFYLGEDFHYDTYCDYFTYSAVSSRLCLKSKELLLELVNQQEILELYKTYLS